MKKHKTTPVVRKVSRLKSVKHSPKKTVKKHLLRRKMLIHKRIMLHPATIFMLLCVGVFLVAWTFRTFAQNVTVTASIFAPLPTSSADITYPVDQVHFITSTLTLSGTCPSNSYVELYRNGNFSGLANCGPGVTSYKLVTDLSIGANELYTRVFNITDNEGPQSAHITIWRDQPVQAPASVPTATPTRLFVTTLDNKSTNTTATIYTSLYPTIRGVAIPFSYIVITFHSLIHICSTYADSTGNWTCTLDEALAEGMHEVDVIAKAPDGKVYNYPTFQIIASKSIMPLQLANSTEAFSVGYSYQYKIYTSGKSSDWNLSINGGKAPYAVTVLWGDGEVSTIVRTNGDSFLVSHIYKLFGKSSKEYMINIKAVDSKESVATLQLSSLVTFNGARPNSSITSLSNTGIYSNLNRFIKRWVWLVWPAYAIVLLMTASFWLGEREEHEKLYTIFKRHTTKKRR